MITHSWNGTVLTVTSDSGTSSADLQGEMGVRGPQGPAGGAINDVSLIDKTLTVENYAADAKAVGDKFAEVVGTSIINSATGGSPLIINDSNDAKLQGLVLYGKTTESSSVGDSGSVKVTVSGKNIVKGLKFSASGLSNSSTSAVKTNSYGTKINATTGNPIIIEQSQVKDAASPHNYTNGYIAIGFFAPLKVGDKITVSFNFITTNNPMNNLTLNGYLNAGGANGDIFLKLADESTGLYRGAFTVRQTQLSDTDNWHYIDIRIAGKSGVLSNFQVEFGLTKAEQIKYEPYKEQTITIPTSNNLRGIPVTSNSNYTDASGQQWGCDKIDFNKGTYTQKVYKEVFNGTEDWTLNGDGEIFVTKSQSIPTADLQNDILWLCSHYPAVTGYDTYKNGKTENYQGVSIKGAYIRFVDNVNYSQNVDAFKVFLAEQYAAGTPVTLYYILRNPVETELTAEQMETYAVAALRTYKPTTTITSDAGLTVDYVADTKLYIDNRLNAITQAIISLGGNV